MFQLFCEPRGFSCVSGPGTPTNINRLKQRERRSCQARQGTHDQTWEAALKMFFLNANKALIPSPLELKGCRNFYFFERKKKEKNNGRPLTIPTLNGKARTFLGDFPNTVFYLKISLLSIDSQISLYFIVPF